MDDSRTEKKYSTIPKDKKNTTPIKTINIICYYNIYYSAEVTIGDIEYSIVFKILVNVKTHLLQKYSIRSNFKLSKNSYRKQH